MTDPRYFWVGFNLVKGVGAARFRLLLDAFGDAEQAWQAPAQALRQAGLSSRIVEALQKVRASDLLERTWQQIQSQGIQVLTWEQAAYPRLLKEIEQPPPVLYARGEVTEDDDWAVAIVGTRRLTAYGRQVAEDLAAAMARNGISVVSGLARGVDAIAHQACFEKWRAHAGRFGQRGRSHLPTRTPPPGAGDRRPRSHPQRLSPGHAAGSGQLPAPQPHYLRPGTRHGRRRGRAYPAGH